MTPRQPPVSAVHAALCRVLPDPARQWVLAHGGELENIEGRGDRWRWRLGLGAVFLGALVMQIRRDPRSLFTVSTIGGAVMRTVLATLSIVNMAGGAALLIAAAVGGQPAAVPILGAALMIQGGYTMALELSRDPSRVAITAQLVGSTLAVVAGTAGFFATFAANIAPAGGDPEYGPMAIMLLVAMHGAASIAVFASAVSSSADRGG